MAITQDSIRKSAGDGRDFGNRPPIRQSNGENTSTAGRTSSETILPLILIFILIRRALSGIPMI